MPVTLVINRNTGERVLELTNEIIADNSHEPIKTLADLIVKWGMETGEIDRIKNNSEPRGSGKV